MMAPVKHPDQNPPARQDLGVKILEIGFVAFLVVSAGVLAWIVADGGFQQVFDVQAGKTGGLITEITKARQG
jgi:hypothetical protein